MRRMGVGRATGIFFAFDLLTMAHFFTMSETSSNAGRKRGRQMDAGSTSGKIRELLKTGMSAGDIAKKLGCRAALVYNVKARMGMATKRGPGRPKGSKNAAKKPAAAMPAGLDGLSGIIAAVRNSEQQRTQLRATLERIHTMVRAALD